MLEKSPIAASGPLLLLQEKQSQAGILILHSIEGGKNKGDVLLSVIRMGDFMESVISFSKNKLKSV